MFRNATRALLRPPLLQVRVEVRQYASSQPVTKPDTSEADSGNSEVTSEASTVQSSTSGSTTSSAYSTDSPTSPETEEKIKAYVASLRDIPIPLGPPQTPPPTTETQDAPTRSDAAGPVKEATSEASSTSRGSTSDVTDGNSETLTSPSTSTPSPSSANTSPPEPSSDFSSLHKPTQEEWEQKYADLRQAYNERITSLRSATQRKTTEMLQAAGEALAVVGLKINETTGYREVERLKKAVKERENDISSHRADVRAAKRAYEEAVSTLSSTQSSVNSLLERKHSWTDSDVASFTKLVRADHSSRASVATTSEALKAAEINVDKSFTALMQAILERYHEEQVWSDKIRSVSTWAQIAALVANMIVFVGAIAFIEPWKRRRLVEGLEERVAGMMDRVEGEIKVLGGSVAALTAERGLERGVKADEGVPEWYVPAELAEVAVLGGEGETSSVPVAEPVVEGGAPVVPAVAIASTASEFVTDAAVVAPLDTLATSAPEATRVALRWINDQLAYIAPPSVERDLGAAAVAGALGSVLVIGLAAIVRGLVR